MTATRIESRQNSKIKQIRSLRQRKQRTESGLFVVEGLHHVGEAVEAKADIEYIVYSLELLRGEFGKQLIGQMIADEISCFETNADIFAGLSDKENPQGIIAVVKQPKALLTDLNSDAHPWCVTLVEPQDPGNLGTILRTVDSVGASALILIGNAVDTYHPKAVRASMGSIFWRPIVRASFDEFTQWSQENKYHLYGSSSNTGDIVTGGMDVEYPAILLLGSEREGLSKEHVQQCEKAFRLPIRGRATSLNLAVAAGVLLYAMRPK